MNTGRNETKAAAGAALETQPINLDIDSIRERYSQLKSLERHSAAAEILVSAVHNFYRIITIRDDKIPEMWVYDKGVYIPQGATFVQEFLRKVLDKIYYKDVANKILDRIRVDTYRDAKEFFSVKNVEEIAVQNGILNLRTRTLSEFTPDKIFFNKLPVVYLSGANCPLIKKHLRDVVGNENDYLILQELSGYLLWREHFIEKAFMFVGSGRNGKGKTIELMKKLLGSENCANIPLQDLERDNFALGELFNKLANFAADISNAALRNTGNFKSLTGRDLISAARKFLPRVNFVNFSKQIFSANELPQSKDVTHAFWARWVVIQFPYRFEGPEELQVALNEGRTDVKPRDPNIVSKLDTPEEMSGFLNFALEGLQRLLSQGDFTYSMSTEEIRKLWVARSDSFAAFSEAQLEFDGESETPKSDLRKAYLGYCKARKLKVANETATKKALTDEGVYDKQRKVDGVRLWVGVRVTGVTPETGVNLLIQKSTYRVIDSKYPVTPVTPVTESWLKAADWYGKCLSDSCEERSACKQLTDRGGYCREHWQAAFAEWQGLQAEAGRDV